MIDFGLFDPGIIRRIFLAVGATVVFASLLYFLVDLHRENEALRYQLDQSEFGSKIGRVMSSHQQLPTNFPILIIFIKIDCEYCEQMMELLVQLKVTIPIVVILPPSTSASELQSFNLRWSMADTSVIIDNGSMSSDYEADVYPILYLQDAHRKLIWKKVGCESDISVTTINCEIQTAIDSLNSSTHSGAKLSESPCVRGQIGHTSKERLSNWPIYMEKKITPLMQTLGDNTILSTRLQSRAGRRYAG